MKPLRIPFSAPHKTARRSRWAVWRAGLLALVLLFFWSVGRLQATQNPFAGFTPVGTRFVLHLRPTETTWNRLLPLLAKEPILGGVSLGEISSFLDGSLVLFFTESGERVVGIEGELATREREVLQNHGLFVTDVQDGLTLFSLHPTETQPMNQHVGKLERVLPSFAGSLIDLQQGPPHTIIRSRGEQVTLELPTKQSITVHPLLTEQAIFAGTFGEGTGNTVPDFLDTAFSSVTGGSDLSELFLGEGGQGAFTLFADGSHLLEVDHAVPLPTIQKFLRLEDDLKHPKTTIKRLEDGSRVDELRLSPDSIPIETLRDGEWEVARLTTETSELFGARNEEENRSFFTNSPDILIARTRTKEEKTSFSCGNSSDFLIKIAPFLSELLEDTQHLSTAMPFSNSLFVQAGIDKGFFGSKIVFCTEKTVDNSQE